MNTKLNGTTIGALALVCGLALPMQAKAQTETVTLRSIDGSLDFMGVLIGFENNNYLISTNLGELRVSADQVSCSGTTCPTINTGSADVLIGGSDTVGLGLMPLLIDGFAGSLQAVPDVAATGNQNEILASLVGDAGFGDEISSILVTSTTSGNGFDKLQNQVIDVSMASRRIRPAEARELRDSGAGNMVSPSQEHIIAVDSLVLVTNPANAVAYVDPISGWSNFCR